MIVPDSFSTTLLIKVECFVRELLELRLPAGRYFHNLEHTIAVVNQSATLAEQCQLNFDETEMLSVAAWFHDTGYIIGSLHHEIQSAQIAREFLSSVSIPRASITTITDLILATRIPSSPVTTMQRILCDADLGHLGSPEYCTWESRLKRELEAEHHIGAMDPLEWTKKNILFFKGHTYYTEAAQRLWNTQKQRNLATLYRKASTC